MKLLIIEFLSDSCDKICKSHKMWNRNMSLPQHLHTCAINTMVSTLRTFHLYLIVFTGGKPARFIMIIIYYRVLWDNEITTYTNRVGLTFPIELGPQPGQLAAAAAAAPVCRYPPRRARHLGVHSQRAPGGSGRPPQLSWSTQHIPLHYTYSWHSKQPAGGTRRGTHCL